MKKYMTEVCSTPVLTGWHKERCQGLTSFLEGTMMEDDLSYNRKSLRSEDLCQKFWLQFLDEERDHIATERQGLKIAMKHTGEDVTEARRKFDAESKNRTAPESQLTLDL